jgi:hypothetical protein
MSTRYEGVQEETGEVDRALETPIRAAISFAVSNTQQILAVAVA